MGIDTVFDRDGRTIFEDETTIVEKWLVENKIPRNYRVLMQGFREQISVNTYLMIERTRDPKSVGAKYDIIYNRAYEILFCGTPSEVIEWLAERVSMDPYRVYSQKYHMMYSAHVYVQKVSPYDSFEGETVVNEELVHKWGLMNPKQETLLWSNELENGMSVIVEDMEKRYDITDDMDPMREALVMTYNRFCTVSRLVTHYDESITFVGVYSDGVQITRRGERRDGWVVKKYTLPQVPVEEGTPNT